jgi:ankyrin repeat protein
MDLPPPPPPKSSSSPSPFGLVSVCGLVTELEDVGRVVALAGFGQEARRLPFLCRSLYLDEELLAATRDAVYGGLDRTRLMYAARVGAVRRVQVLLRPREVDVDAEDERGCTALIHASAAGQTESARLLLDKGASVNSADVHGWRVLHFASVAGHASVARLLLDGDAEVDEGERTDQPLHLACEHGHQRVVEMLLDAGADEGASDTKLRTPFCRAVQRGHLALVTFLLDRGQGVEDGKDEEEEFFRNNVPLFLAAEAGQEAMVRLLLDRGADVHMRSNFGTALHGAALGGSLAVTELLMAEGCDPMEMNTHGCRPGDIAMFQDVINRVLEDPDTVDNVKDLNIYYFCLYKMLESEAIEGEGDTM